MGEEREARTEPCMCGAGTVLIEAFSPDHPWGGATRYQAEFQCDICARQYLISGNGVVRRVDHERRSTAERALATARHDLMASIWARELLKAAASYVDQKPSRAAIYRALDHVGLAGYSQGHFTKRWQSGTDWVSKLTTNELPQLLTLLGRDASEPAKSLAEIEAMRSALPIVPVLRQLHP